MQIEIPKQRLPCASAANTLNLNCLSVQFGGHQSCMHNSQDKALRQPGLHTLPRAKNDRVVCVFTLSLSHQYYMFISLSRSQPYKTGQGSLCHTNHFSLHTTAPLLQCCSALRRKRSKKIQMRSLFKLSACKREWLSTELFEI